MYTCEQGQHSIEADQIHTAYLEETGEVICQNHVKEEEYQFQFSQMVFREAVC